MQSLNNNLMNPKTNEEKTSNDAKKIGLLAPIEIVPVIKPTFSDVDKKTVKLVGDDILEKVWPKADIHDKFHFQWTFLAMFKSAKQHIVEAIQKVSPSQWEKDLKEMYEAYLKIDKRDTSSSIQTTRIKAQWRYYQNAFEKRNIIQNYCWNYRGMDESAESFIRLYERAKAYFKCFERSRWKGFPCLICHQPCVPKRAQVCDYCYDFKKLQIFIKLSSFFKIIGSFYLFLYFLPDGTDTYLLLNWDKLEPIFNKSFDFNVFKKYAAYIAVQEITFTENFTSDDVKDNDEIKEKPKKKEKTYLLKRKRPSDDILEEVAKLKDETKFVSSLDDIGDKSLV